MPCMSTIIVFLLKEIIPPRYEELLPEVINGLKLLAQKSVHNAWEEMHPQSFITVHGSWNHIELICKQTHKIVDYEILHKSIRNFNGNYERPSYLMESTAFKKKIPRFLNEIDTIKLLSIVCMDF